MKLLKRITAAAVTAGLVLSLAACSGTKGEKLPEKQTVDHVYKASKLEISEQIDYMQALSVAGDGYSAKVGINDDTDGYYYAKAEFDGDFNLKELKKFELDMGDGYNYDPYISAYCSGKDEKSWAVVNASYYDEKNDYSEYKSFLVKFDSEQRPEVKLSLDMLTTEEASDIYVNTLAPYGEGGVLAALENRIVTFDAAGNKTSDKSFDSNDGIMYMNAVIPSSKGIVLSYYSESYIPCVCVYDPESGKLGDPISLGGISYYNYYPGNSTYDIICVDENGIYGLNTDSNDGTVELMNFLNSDLEQISPDSLIAFDDMSFIYSGYAEDGYELKKLTPVPESETTPKYTLELAGFYISYNIKKQVSEFNRSSDEYRIKIHDYSDDIEYTSLDSRMSAYTDMINRFNNDIAAGNVADIVVNSSNSPFESYASKGMFENLYEYIDKDAELSRDDFEKNVLTALETDGKLYRILPEYQVLTFAAKNKFVGDYVGNMTIENLMKLAKSLPEGVEMFQGATRTTLLTAFVSFMYNEFVTGDKCSFDDGGFANLLEFSSTLGDKDIFDTTSSDDMDDEFWRDYDNVYRDDKVVMSSLAIYDFDALREQINTVFGTEDISLIGFPSQSGGSAVISDSGSSISISSKSALKDGAWAFVKMLLSSDFQDKLDYTLPLRTDSLEKMMTRQVKESKERYDEQKENGSVIGGGGEVSYITDDGKVITRSYEDSNDDELVPYLTEDCAKKVLDCIRGANMIYNTDNEINDIITEEAQKYFDGQCTADAAAASVQSRVSIYLGEKNA